MLALIDGDKKCPRCKIGTEFHKGAWYCKACCNEKSRIWHSKRENLDRRNKAVQARMKIRKQEIIDKFGGKCLDCGGIFPSAVYDFHHLDPNEKEYNPSYMAKMNPKRAEEELKKCVLLCANCHRVRHYG